MTTLLHGVPKPLPGERILGVHPTIAPQANTTWRKRTNFFSGRSVSPFALEAEQAHRAGHLATTGQFLAAGVIAGLEVGLELEEGEWVVHVSPGLGICASGEDVRLTEPLRMPLEDLVAGSPPSLEAMILFLQPIQVRRTAEQDPGDPCELNAEDIAFEDEQIVDGVRLCVADYPFPVPAIGEVEGEERETWRNRLAYEIFRQEALLGPGGILPWEGSGVGIGLLGMSDGSPQFDPFIDMHAVARDGGQLNRRRAFVGSRGTRRLWQAQVRQFMDHVEDISLTTLSEEGFEAHFTFLPPVGTLPREVIGMLNTSLQPVLDVRGDRGEAHLPLPPDSLFPTRFVLESVPVELESLDDFLRVSAGTEPFDLSAGEQVQVLVPVPQRHFSPDLLRVEDETPDEFRLAIRVFLLRLNHRLGRRVQVRADERRLQPLLFGTYAEHPERDLEAVGGEVLVGFPSDDDLPDTDPQEPVEEPYAENIEEKIEALGLEMAKTTGAVPIAFFVEKLRSEADQNAFTPNLGAVNDQAAGRFLSTKAGRRGLVGFVEDLSKRLLAAGEAMDFAFSNTASNLFQLSALASGEEFATKLATSPALPFLVRKRITETSVVQGKAFERFTARPEAPVGGGDPLPPIPLPTRVRRFLRFRGISLPAAEDITPALVFNSNIRQRIEAPKALLVLNNAARAKRAAFRTLRSIHQSGLSMNGLLFHGCRVDNEFLVGGLGDPPDVIDPSFLQPEDPATPPTRTYSDIGVPIEWVIAFLGYLERDGYWPHDDVEISVDGAADEGAIMSTAFESVEHSIAALRIGEARLIGYERSLNLARTRMEGDIKTWDRIQRRLLEIGDDIDEFRHDVLVARALELEEIARAKRVNAERNQVLREHVPFLVFRRPRTVDGLQASPTQVIEPAVVPDAVPACLREDFEIPDALRGMVDLLREAPIAWLPELSVHLAGLNRYPALQQLVGVAYHRANNPATFEYNPFDTGAFADETGEFIRGVFEAQRKALDVRRADRLKLTPYYFNRFGWRRMADELQDFSTLNDLLITNHGRQDVCSRVAKHLNDLSRVTACLFEHLRAVAPLLRFQWLELLSTVSTSPDLRQLSILPDWERIDPSDQRDMQQLVDWLYEQIDLKKQDAVDFMHDLVRMTILLSSHAPIHQALTATPVNVRPVVAGDTIEVRIDLARVRVGLHILLFESEGPVPSVGQGVIEDLTEGIATVRVAVTESDRSIVPIRSQLLEPDRNPSLTLADGSEVGVGVVGPQ